MEGKWQFDKADYVKTSYVRGYIWHVRSNATQQWLFHFLYGGFQHHFIKRNVVDYWIKVMARVALLPTVIYYTGACLGQRDYDNNAYDYFYFSD